MSISLVSSSDYSVFKHRGLRLLFFSAINLFCFIISMTDVVTEFIEGLVETYPGLQYLDGFPEVIFYKY